jgi:hypothetical protein
VVQLYPRALGSLSVASYDSQGYGGGIVTLPKPGGPGPRINIPRNRVVQFYPRALGPLSVASYNSQGYGGGIVTCLHMGCALYNISYAAYCSPASAQERLVCFMFCVNVSLNEKVTVTQYSTV